MSDEKNYQGKTGPEQNLDLLKDFPPPTYDDWEKMVGKDLVSKTYEGIDLKPIYRKEDIKDIPFPGNMPGFPSYVRGTGAAGYLEGGWEICQEIKCSSVEEFNRELKHSLHRGQTAINLILDRAARMGLDSDRSAPGEVGVDGTSISTYEDFSKAISGIDLEKYPLFVDSGLSGLEILMMFTAFCNKNGIDMTEVRGSIEGDFLELLLEEGRILVSLKSAFDRLALGIRFAGRFSPRLKTIGVKGSIYHNAGADAARELAFSLSAAVEYIDQMLERNLRIDEIARAFRFTFGIGSFYFMEVAKLRAARMLWARIVEAYGGDEESQKMTIHARTSFYNQTWQAPYVNMLRTTSEAFSAVVGGANSLHTNAFDESSGKTDRFSRRIARNTQVILKEEAHLDRLIDPAGGSYYIEKLTFEVAHKAWSVFQEIQKRGGMLKALQQGYPQEEIERVAEQRENDNTNGKRIIVGCNAYTDESEEELVPYLADKEEISRMRAGYLNKYRASRDKTKHTELVRKIPGLIAAKKSNIIQTGADSFLAGATLGEIFYATRIETGELILINPLRFHRAAGVFEKPGKKKGES